MDEAPCNSVQSGYPVTRPLGFNLLCRRFPEKIIAKLRKNSNFTKENSLKKEARNGKLQKRVNSLTCFLYIF